MKKTALTAIVTSMALLFGSTVAHAAPASQGAQKHVHTQAKKAPAKSVKKANKRVAKKGQHKRVAKKTDKKASTKRMHVR